MTYIVVSKRNLAIGIFLLGLAVLVSSMLGFVGGKEAPRPSQYQPNPSYLEDIRVLSIQDNKVAYSLTATKAQLAENGKETALENISMQVPEQGVITKAPSGDFNLESGELRLAGNITTEMKGYDVLTNSLQIRPGGKISTGQKVIIKGKGMEIEGQGLETGEEKTLRLKNNVKAKFE